MKNQHKKNKYILNYALVLYIPTASLYQNQLPMNEISLRICNIFYQEKKSQLLINCIWYSICIFQLFSCIFKLNSFLTRVDWYLAVRWHVNIHNPFLFLFQTWCSLESRYSVWLVILQKKNEAFKHGFLLKPVPVFSSLPSSFEPHDFSAQLPQNWRKH